VTRAREKVIPWEFPDFSTTQVFQMANFGVPMKVYRAGTSVRMERSAAWSTLYTPYHIYNLTSYPDGSKQCVVMRPEQVKLLPSPVELLNGTKVHRTLEGTDVVEGHRCKVEKVVVTRPDGKTIESKVWEAEDLKRYSGEDTNITAAAPLCGCLPGHSAGYSRQGAVYTSRTVHALRENGTGGREDRQISSPAKEAFQAAAFRIFKSLIGMFFKKMIATALSVMENGVASADRPSALGCCGTAY